ncbi:GDP-mannose 4,6-dehydratase [Sporomusa acidovorans DSM 3132]|uniref:GDP-mannose 4,6-dehydratase n=2 Tax=Sporomusa TaxID=2375 RepID=A0ABZ3J9A5_SPOA4|nr:GDP-mannose 4,6-dehydratase [Sporomusa acidovorans DSM 3132]SDE95496.1 GDP-mannose 4,6 dehydratase [Sporomusa acidovorans]
MLQQEKPDDYVVASGEAHSVREFVETAFRNIGIDISWQPQMSFQELVSIMIAEDIKRAERDRLCAGHGFALPRYQE